MIYFISRMPILTTFCMLFHLDRTVQRRDCRENYCKLLTKRSSRSIADFHVSFYIDRVHYAQEKSQDSFDMFWIKIRKNSSNFESILSRLYNTVFWCPCKYKHSEFQVPYYHLSYKKITVSHFSIRVFENTVCSVFKSHKSRQDLQKLAKTWIYLTPYVCTEGIFDSWPFMYHKIFLKKLL